MINQEQLTAASHVLLEKNLRILQGYRLAPTDRQHVERLLDYMAPDASTRWLDIGCGFGEPARLMKELRPDLDFWMVNNNLFQLSHTSDQAQSYCCDMHELPFLDASFDGTMFLYSLCQADDWKKALQEAARVVRQGGRLFVFDYLRTAGNDDLARQQMCSQFMSYPELLILLQATGWHIDGMALPEGDDSVFRSVFHDQNLYDRIFAELTPAIWWATRI